jgi:hypothetical protein
MSKKVVSVSFINQAVEFLEAEMTQSGFFTFSPSIATTNESLQGSTAVTLVRLFQTPFNAKADPQHFRPGSSR